LKPSGRMRNKMFDYTDNLTTDLSTAWVGGGNS
jgi:hypothetical protein